jgi:aryl-alcohol dehydrogenase-like predicted oxidoreductase
VGAETVRRAHAVHPICDLQIEYSLISRSIERTILPATRKSGIAITAYGVLSRGLLTASPTATAGDFRAHLPRFTGANGAQNRAMAEGLAHFAVEKGATPAQLSIAWVAAQGDDIIPIVGARTRTQLADSLGALEVHLTPEDTARLESICNPARAAGQRYDAAQMQMLDSEKE